MDAPRSTKPHLQMTVNTNNTEYRGRELRQRLEIRCMRFERLYGAQELLLELAIFAVILGMAFAMCLLRILVSR